jgi:hypothetical protein
MKIIGLGTLSEFLGDFVVYRNLEPCDKRLPDPNAVREALGLPPGGIPRKTKPEYARMVVEMLKAARWLGAPEIEIHSLVFLGDTQLNDATAFRNLCAAGGWKGLCFIGSETASGVAAGTGNVVRSDLADGLSLYSADHWGVLTRMDEFCAASGIRIDQGLVVVVDLDKTALGARGRNAAAIDKARVEAAKITVADLLGEAFNENSFRHGYDTLNQVQYHPFTRDNQDYLAYISLILGAGLVSLDDLLKDIGSDDMPDFEAFIELVDMRAEELLPALKEIHTEILDLVRMGDPTPFKAFRRNEYHETVRRMGGTPDQPLVSLLAEEIFITEEVHAAALQFKEKGALIFGLSDKPDEASIPSPKLAQAGYRPIHQTAARVIGAAKR